MPRRKRKTGTKKNSTEKTKNSTNQDVKEVSKEVSEKNTMSKSKKEAKTKKKPKNEEVTKIKHGFIPTPKVWPDHITKYERSRIIGARALQISMGAPILIEDLEKIGNPVEVAEKELEYGILPLTIRRILPNGEIIDVPLKELLENEHIF